MSNGEIITSVIDISKDENLVVFNTISRILFSQNMNMDRILIKKRKKKECILKE